MKKIIFYILKVLSKGILRKYKPDVIGITGSVGKTTTKRAIELVLRDKFNVRASKRSFNTETGVPLTIIGADNAGKNVFAWILVILKGALLIVFKSASYPKILILEMAADHKGDIKYLVEFTKPKIGVLTSVGATHLEFFGSISDVAREKENIVTSLTEDGTAVINTDQKMLKEISKKVKSNLITYGLKSGVLRADNITNDFEKGNLSFELKYREEIVKVNLTGVIGDPVIYSILGAAGVGLAQGMSLDEIAGRLKFYESMPGRLNLIAGIKYTRIIDDSYNSSPMAASAALELLSKLKCTGDKYAVLGDMLELGAETKKAHRELGERVAKKGIDYLIVVGEAAKDSGRVAEKYGMNPDRIFSFDSSENAGRFLQDRIKEGDLILVKGSRGIHMERIVKEIMAEPGRASEILV